jgi:shikimate kinase
MPGAGKSTVGVILAKQTSRDFVDTDVVIQLIENRPLQDIVDRDGHMELRKIEERILLGLNLTNHVIATGGSAAYSEPAMRHLASHGTIVFLDLPTLVSRVHDFTTRGLAKRPDQTFADLFHERFELYTKYADLTIRCKGLTQEEVCERIVEQLNEEEIHP